MSLASDYLQEHLTVMSQLDYMVPLLEDAAKRIYESLLAGGKVLLMGNGGSAADCQHLAGELVGRFKIERRALPALALTTDTSILTSLSNDYDYSIIFSRQLEAFCRPNDIVIGISTSGNSENIVHGISTAKQLGAYTIGMTGESGGKLVNLVDLCFCVPSKNVARIQEAHIFLGHTICELVDEVVMESESSSAANVAVNG